MRIKKITLSTKYSKAFKINFKFVVAFLKKVNQIEFYYLGKKYSIDIQNDKEEYEISEKNLKELVLQSVKEKGEMKVRKGRKKRGEKLKEVEVKEKKRRGRPKKVK